MTFNRRQFVQTLASTAALALPGVRTAHAQRAEFTLKCASDLPVTHPVVARMIEAAAKIKTETKGRVDIQVFPDNQLGSQGDMISQLRSGAIDFFPTTGPILSTLAPAAGITGMGFAFKDYDTVWAALDGDLGAYVRNALSKVGLYAFPKILDLGFRNVTTSTRPINSLADLSNLKLRVTPNAMMIATFKALGASPVGMSWSELYTALQTKIVEGQETPLPVIQIAKFYEVQKYCGITRHVWDGDWVVMNGKSWAALPKDLQVIVSRVMDQAAIAQRDDVAKLNITAEADLKAKGMVFSTPDLAPFRAKLTSSGFYTEWKGKLGPEAWAVLEKYSGKLA
jgi:tripartite ATP-independent transporter DctP family solute receptor